MLRGKDFNGTVVVWIHPAGKSSLLHDGKVSTVVRKLLDSKAAILAPDVFWTGELAGLVVQVKMNMPKLKELKLNSETVAQAIDQAKLGSVRLTDSHWLFPKGTESEKLKALSDIVVRKGDGEPVHLRDLVETVTREFLPINESFAGYTYGYNRPLLANRVHDILTAVAAARGQEGTKAVHLVGWDKSGPWVCLARGLCGDAVTKTAADFDGFRIEQVRTSMDEMMLPGAVKYGGLPALTALAAPSPLYLHNHRSTGAGRWIKAAYEASCKPERLERSSEKASPEMVVDWLLK